jgi:putative ABC transport system permease protein
VVIGQAIAQRLYPFVDPTGSDIRIDGREYEVIGVFDEKKSAFGGRYDTYVLMPVSTFVRTYGMTDREGWPRSVNVTLHARSPEVVDDAIAETKSILRRLDHNAPDNLTLFNSESTIEQFNTMTSGVKVGAFIIGIVALVVAGIGIMNIMLVSVTERTREIGIRKSLGARPLDILRQFLLEAVVLCNVDGIIGIAFGFLLGNAIVKARMSSTFEMAVPVEWAAIGLLFCAAVGLVFGMLPAIKASRLNPIEALRYE